MLGLSAFSEFPFATAAEDKNVTITATKTSLTITIGSIGITAILLQRMLQQTR